MHIPDGYLNLPTCAVTTGIMAPIWYLSGKKLRVSLRARDIPLLALGAAFSFVLMMFNFPLPGGSSGHAVGGALLAVILGPWAAVCILSVVVAIQALVFHDGGLTTLGANALNMAVVLPFAAYTVNTVLSRAAGSPFHKALAGAVSGFVGLTAAALTTAVMLGMQPHGESGYAPYPLRVTVPVMVGSHLLLFSWVEGLVTGFVLLWFHRSYPQDMEQSPTRPGFLRKVWMLLALLALLSPLGLLGQGTAFGEWSAEELKKLLGYVPFGLKFFSRIWPSPLSGYSIQGRSLVFGYVLSALVGSAATGFFAFVLGKALSRETRESLAAKHFVSPGKSEGALPEWLQKKETVSFREESAALVGVRRSPKSSGMAQVWSRFRVFEEFQKREGFLQRLDPRVKILILMALIILATWVRNPVILLGLLGGAFALALVSRIPVLWYGGYVVLTMVLFSALIALPSAFRWMIPGTPWIVIHAPTWVVTREGALGVLLFTLRATTAISLSVLLGITTPLARLLKGLRSLGIPQLPLFIVEMAHRYIFLFLRLLEQMKFAKEARTISPLSLRNEQRWTATRIAFLFQRSLELSEQVYSAMVARGYDGEIKILERFTVKRSDQMVAAGALLFLLAVVVLELKTRL